LELVACRHKVKPILKGGEGLQKGDYGVKDFKNRRLRGSQKMVPHE
jgi:hypothetical protein